MEQQKIEFILISNWYSSVSCSLCLDQINAVDFWWVFTNLFISVWDVY